MRSLRRWLPELNHGASNRSMQQVDIRIAYSPNLQH